MERAETLEMMPHLIGEIEEARAVEDEPVRVSDARDAARIDFPRFFAKRFMNSGEELVAENHALPPPIPESASFARKRLQAASMPLRSRSRPGTKPSRALRYSSTMGAPSCSATSRAR